MNRSLFRGWTFRIIWAMSRIVAEPDALSSMPGAVDRVEVRVDDDDVVRVAALGLGDDVVVVAVRVDDRLDVEVHAPARVPTAGVLVEQALAGGERGERDRDGRDDRVAGGVDQAAAEHARAAGVALVEDDHAGCARRPAALRTFTPKVHVPRWISAIRPRSEAGEVSRRAAARRAGRRGRRDHDAAGRLESGGRSPTLVPGIPVGDDRVVVSGR